MGLSILALVHRVPFPPNKGEKIRAYHLLAGLAGRGHDVDLLTFADAVEDRAHGPELERFCREVVVVPKDKRLATARSVTALPRLAPLSVGYFDSVRLAATARRWLHQKRYDAVFCYSSPMAEFVRGLPRGAPGRIMDFVDVDSEKWRQYASGTKPPMRYVYKVEARLLASYERRIAREFDVSTLVSAAEVEAFRRVAPDARRIEVLENGVDTAFFGQTTRRERAPRTLVFVGQMDYHANVDGVRFFADEVFPAIRATHGDVVFQIVGRAPTAEVKALAARPGIEVTGTVPDIRDHLGAATMMVAPLRIARGIQNKVLEAMAAGVPVVASKDAFEGIEGTPGRHVEVASTATELTLAVRRLLDRPDARAGLAREAKALVEARYSWRRSVDVLERLVAEVRPGA